MRGAIDWKAKARTVLGWLGFEDVRVTPSIRSLDRYGGTLATYTSQVGYPRRSAHSQRSLEELGDTGDGGLLTYLTGVRQRASAQSSRTCGSPRADSSHRTSRSSHALHTHTHRTCRSSRTSLPSHSLPSHTFTPVSATSHFLSRACCPPRPSRAARARLAVPVGRRVRSCTRYSCRTSLFYRGLVPLCARRRLAS